MKHLSQIPQYVEAATEIQTLSVALGKVRTRMVALEALMRAGSPLDGEHGLLREQGEALESALRACRQVQPQLFDQCRTESCATQEARRCPVGLRRGGKAHRPKRMGAIIFLIG